MTKKVDTWMPFYVTDYLGDTMHLNTAQHGAYLLMLLACWKSGGEIPDDEGQLACITRLQIPEWRRHSDTLRRFFSAADGVLRHGRVMAELAKAKLLSEKRSAIGKLGGRPANEKQEQTNSFPIAEAKSKQNETPSPSPFPKGKTPLTPQGVESADRGFEAFYAAYPRKQAKAAAKKAFVSIKPTDELLAVMLEAINRDAASEEWQRDKGRFIPYPATWLNGRRWEDVPGSALSSPSPFEGAL